MLSIGLSAFLHYSWNCNYRTTSNHLLTLSLSNVQYYRKLIFVTDEQNQNFNFFDPTFQLLQLCNSSADWAKDLFKASTDSSWDWRNYFFVLGFPWVTSQWGHVFATFWPISPDPGHQPNEPFFGSSFIWKLHCVPHLQSSWMTF